MKISEMHQKVEDYLVKKLNRKEYSSVTVEYKKTYTDYVDVFSTTTKFNIYYNGGNIYSGSTFNEAFKLFKKSFNNKKIQDVEI